VAAIKAAAATANRLRILVGFAVRFTFDTISPNNKSLLQNVLLGDAVLTRVCGSVALEVECRGSVLPVRAVSTVFWTWLCDHPSCQVLHGTRLTRPALAIR
jgi:hypothetical protein